MAVVEPDRTLGAYANGNADAGPEETPRIFGEAKLARLGALKRAWDPDNVFHVNPNVAPGVGAYGFTAARPPRRGQAPDPVLMLCAVDAAPCGSFAGTGSSARPAGCHRGVPCLDPDAKER